MSFWSVRPLKTTIIKLLTGEVRPSEGRVIVNNYDIGRMKKAADSVSAPYIGRCLSGFPPDQHQTVYENVAFAMRAIGAKGKAIKQRVPYVLDLVGLVDKAHEKPMNLPAVSSSVSHRACVGQQPALIIADEPTGNLDPARSLER